MKGEVLDLSGFVVGETYSRADITRIGLVSPKNATWGTGIGEFENAVLLFVTLEKTDYHYRDQFDGGLFWWQSQTRQTQTDRILQSLTSGEREAHIFCRVRAKQSATFPFVYCGRLSAPLMDGEKPVTCLFEALDIVEDAKGELARVYEWRPGKSMEAAETDRRQLLLENELSKPRARGQGRVRDYQRRRVVEMYAMDLAKKHYAALGFKVTDTSSTHPYDLSCLKNDRVTRVEVKGTQTTGSTVDVTVAEVESARCGEKLGYATDLFVVHSIRLTGAGDSIHANGGTIHKISDWFPMDARLKTMTFRYEVERI
ncbi:DUF3427 domain-containing protein [Luteibacter sp. OK325]|uniref:DUF3427 domain-containing protein n=1 Tax=Luteibacter sp. OK325 TaxID=2135670 RepID=UPI000D363FEB|nr:DUF3427 domain-containing protein [Luteibacter sp. OK325]